MADFANFLAYLELITGSVAAFAAVVLLFVWRAYQSGLERERSIYVDQSEKHMKMMEVLNGVTSALNGVKDQIIELRHQIERLHDNR